MVNPNKWLDVISQQLPSSRVGNKLIIDGVLAKGYASIEVLQDGLYYIVINAAFAHPIVYERVTEMEEEHYLIIISLTDGPVFSHLDKREYRFKTSENFNALVVPPSVLSYMKAEEGETVQLLTIVVDKQWINDNIIGRDQNSPVNKILNAGVPIPIIDSFSHTHKGMIESLFFHKYKDKIQKLSSVIFLISNLIDHVSRQDGNQGQLLNVNDINLILESCRIIEDNWKRFPSIKTLSSRVKMGESNFKLKFKKVTGYAPYQYYLKIKMEKARELLQNTDKSVSEVGYLCGYTNLSHFSRQFKKEFGNLPSDVVINRSL